MMRGMSTAPVRGLKRTPAAPEVALWAAGGNAGDAGKSAGGCHCSAQGCSSSRLQRVEQMLTHCPANPSASRHHGCGRQQRSSTQLLRMKVAERSRDAHATSPPGDVIAAYTVALQAVMLLQPPLQLAS